MKTVTARQATFGLGVLTLINFLNYLDRYIVAGAMPRIQETFGINKQQGGMIGALFIIVYMVAAPLGGRLGDTRSRRLLVAGSVFLWSLATFGSGFSVSFATLLLARAFVGIGEAGYVGVAPGLISDLFPPSRRTSMLAVFYVAVPLGSAMGFIVGQGLSAAYSWKIAFFAGGIPGLLVALLALFMPEPERGATESIQEPKVPFAQGLRNLLPNGTFWTATAGLTLMTFSIGGLAFWMPSFLEVERHLKPGRAGLLFGAVTALAGTLGTLTGGWLGERAERKRHNGGLALSGMGLLLAAPFIALAALVKGPLHLGLLTVPMSAGIFGAIFVAQFLIFLNTGPLAAAVINSVSPHFRAFATGLNVLCFHLLGDAISPPIIGALGDRYSLGTAILLNSIPVLLGGVVLLLGARLFSAPREALL